MIIQRYINREILITSAAILMVLVLIFISSRFISYIQLAVDGVISSATVFKLVALKIPSVAGFLLPLSFFLATLMTLGRLYSESEMAVLKSVGLSDFVLAKNIFSVAVLLALISALLSFWINPWATHASQIIKAEGQAEAQLSGFMPGRFKENKQKTGVLFVESKTESEAIQGLFSVSGLNSDAKQWVIQTAASGKISENINNPHQNTSDQVDKSSLVLHDGKIYTFDLVLKQWQITQYQDYYMQLEKPNIKDFSIDTNATSSLALLQQKGKAVSAELHWRLSAPLSILVLCFAAVPLSRTEPRKGKFSRLLPAILLYMIYAVLLMNGRKMIETGKVIEILGFWWIHLIAVAFCVWRYKSMAFKKRKILSHANV